MKLQNIQNEKQILQNTLSEKQQVPSFSFFNDREINKMREKNVIYSQLSNNKNTLTHSLTHSLLTHCCDYKIIKRQYKN
jgi:hypothetical protein